MNIDTRTLPEAYSELFYLWHGSTTDPGHLTRGTRCSTATRKADIGRGRREHHYDIVHSWKDVPRRGSAWKKKAAWAPGDWMQGGLRRRR
eukprot:7854646-Pyramimonas_sp.AAC.1